MLAPNRNFLWTRVFVDELARTGLKAVCIAPGSRSTPLTMAFAEHGGIRIYPHMDERSAGFFALGMAMATNEPIALVCTSGSATANFFPAIVEAHESRIPLIVLTTDRPPELRHSGANQTIDQIKMYGDYALWSVDAPVPESQPAALTIRALRTLAARAYATADGIGGRKGVVHVNLPFRKPLEPIEVETDHTELTEESGEGYVGAFTVMTDGAMIPSVAQMTTLVSIIDRHERGIIVCGTKSLGENFTAAVAQLSQRTGYPIFADPTSDVRFGSHVESTAVIGGYDTFLNYPPTWEDPDVVIRFGGVPTSTLLNAYLDKIKPKHRVQVSADGVWADDSHRTHLFVHADPTLLCLSLSGRLQTRPESRWAGQIRMIEAVTWLNLGQRLGDEFFDGQVVADLIERLPDGTNLFAGNSLPIRHVEQFGRPSTKHLHVFANRGASGIDGNVSTALGIAAATGKPTVMLVGDITLYHDMNGLLAVQKCGVDNITIVLLNNDGGGIFHRLPVSKFDPPFTELFVMPHGLRFEHVAALYNLAFIRANNREDFRQAVDTTVGSRIPRMIEIRTDAAHDEARRKQIQQKVTASLQR